MAEGFTFLNANPNSAILSAWRPLPVVHSIGIFQRECMMARSSAAIVEDKFDILNKIS